MRCGEETDDWHTKKISYKLHYVQWALRYGNYSKADSNLPKYIKNLIGAFMLDLLSVGDCFLPPKRRV